MLVKGLMSQTTTDKQYTEVLKKRKLLYYIILFLGAITIACSFIFSSKQFNYLSESKSSLYAGMGSGIMAISIIFIIRLNKILKNEILIKQKRVEEQDERIQMILQKSSTTASEILMILMYIALMISGIFNMVVFYTLYVFVGIYIVTYAISYLYYKKTL